MTERRTFNTPLREPLNPIIYQSLRAIDWHNAQYFLTMDQWHLEKAAIIRQYVRELKAWIYEQEERDVASLGEGVRERRRASHDHEADRVAAHPHIYFCIVS
jgi:hypothetical protein